ncbi:MAG: DNA-binding protein [Deltaproteobacteria bacterium]|nr:MAG: DNA-binding protein [Deltaproteobacteria bacterium]
MAKKKKEIDDRFKKFGIVSFTGITKVNDFVEFLEQGKVMGMQCKGCGRKYFPPRADCCHCLESSMEWFEISGTGKLVTYSQLQYAPLGFEADLPYCIALLDYGEYKVFGRINKELPEEELKIGMEMKTQAIKLPNGQLSYEFIKA